MVFDLFAEAVRRPGEPAADVFAYVTTRTHQLAAYRCGLSGSDDLPRGETL